MPAIDTTREQSFSAIKHIRPFFGTVHTGIGKNYLLLPQPKMVKLTENFEGDNQAKYYVSCKPL